MLRIYGSIAVESPPDVEEIAIPDPAEYAAMALKRMLEARGVEVKGMARAKHRAERCARDFITAVNRPEPLESSSLPAEGQRCPARMLRRRAVCWRSHRSAPLQDDVVVTNKVSQNLHAELLLRALSLAREAARDGSIVGEGASMVRAF